MKKLILLLLCPVWVLGQSRPLVANPNGKMSVLADTLISPAKMPMSTVVQNALSLKANQTQVTGLGARITADSINVTSKLSATTAASTYQPIGTYLTANQSITLSGDVTGSGATGITTTLAKKISSNTLNKSANYTIASSDFATGNNTRLTVYCDDTSGSFTITLPSALSGYPIDIVKTNSSSNAVTISGAAGTFNIISGQYQTKSYISNGSIWANN